ncbi:phosphate:acyl-[acyl carrier protein] acyltransferase [Ureibacillus xyleni]|uniref:Phosphate acyltransferase n=1 Tax=Ureibacillus xyleni TaxID=614648 RepID=A0A285RFC6_9BACL|nr:phosphate acyltransferase PlsX [Ureibacillus xyleni]SOB92780.1 phosphate:acyl-[acyl carrier protein] acyltransferase [Ureibacillus xyleni]
MKLAIDGMGGDNAPKAVVEGVLLALDEFPNIEIQLYGNQRELQPFIKEHSRLEVIHCEEVVEAEDDPARAVRRKKDSSMARMLEAVNEGRADACLSAGNTGALMAGGLFKVGRIEGVSRPALATTLPTIDGKGFLMLDLGANADAKPENIVQYAIMGNIYAKKVRGIENPRVGLLNIGTEEKKGNDLTKSVYGLLKEADFNFVGNVEARDLLDNVADVVVTDGFTGNMVLKTIEGTAGALMSMLKDVFMASGKTKIGALLVKGELKNLKSKLDYSEHGGAALFGLQAPVVKAHGSSNGRAIYNAIRQASIMVEHNVTDVIKTTIAENPVQE